MTDHLTIRLSDESDSLALGRLAQLDSTLYDGSPALVAEAAGGRLVAAVMLGGGTSFSDPFERSAGALALLELRRGQLTRAPGRSSKTRRRRRRRVRAQASA